MLGGKPMTAWHGERACTGMNMNHPGILYRLSAVSPTALLDLLDYALEIWISCAEASCNPIPAALGNLLTIYDHVELPSLARSKFGFHAHAFLDGSRETRDLRLIAVSRRAVNYFDFHIVLQSFGCIRNFFGVSESAFAGFSSFTPNAPPLTVGYKLTRGCQSASHQADGHIEATRHLSLQLLTSFSTPNKVHPLPLAESLLLPNCEDTMPKRVSNQAAQSREHFCVPRLRLAFSGLFCSSLILVSCGGGTNSLAPPPPPPPPAPQFQTFLQGATLSSGIAHPEGVVVADFNGDGKPDIAVSNFDTNTVAVFLNDGSGNFGDPVVTTVQLTNAIGLNVGALAVGDFNQDGKPDLVVGTIAGSQVSIVLLGKGDGTFNHQTPIPNSFGFFQAKVVDLNGDGHQDLVFAENGNISVSLGKGDGTFAASVQLQSASMPGVYQGIAVADFDGDGKLDIVASDLLGANLVFYAGNGDGTLATPTSVSLPNSDPGSLANADFNGDGKQDVLIGFPNTSLIAAGNGDGTFKLDSPELVYQNSAAPSTNTVFSYASDLMGNGKSDAITADFYGGVLQITLNSALGQIPPNSGIFSFSLAPGISAVATGDLNGDGVLDVVVADYTTSQVNIILSKSQ